MPTDILDIRPPLLGVDRRLAYQFQAPFSCDNAVNVWPRDPLKGRMRVGSRPGLVKVFPTGVTGPCHLLANVRAVEDTKITTFSDEFIGDEFVGYWSQSSWRPHIPLITDGYAYVVRNQNRTPNDAAIVLKSLIMDVTEDYTVTLKVLATIVKSSIGIFNPLANANGDFSIYVALDDSIPDAISGGTEVRFTPTTQEIGTVSVYVDGALTAGPSVMQMQAGTFGATFPPVLFSVTVDSSNNAAIKVNGGVVTGLGSVALGSPAGQRTGFGINGTLNTSTQETRRRVDYFRVDYAGAPPSPVRNIVVAAGGTNASSTHSNEVDLQYEDTPNVLAVPTVSGEGSGDDLTVTNPNARQLQAAEYLGRLYIVGEDSTEAATATKEIGEPVWQFSPIGTGSLVRLNSSSESSFPYVSGLIPGNCTAIAAWNNRICVVSRDDPHNISMSRYEIPGDWTYGSIPVGSATQLNTTGIDTGKLSEPVNALVAHSDDYLVIGCFSSLYVQRGDPTLGGQIDRLSSNIGIVAPQAWAYGPNSEIVFISTDGLYGLASGINSYPQSISRERLPNELRDIDVNNYRILMAYDVRNRGVFIGLTPTLGGGGTYFWLDWENRGFWPMEFDPAFEPTSLVYRNADSPLDQRLLFGCRDGNIRAMDDLAFTDDGLNYKTELLIGPIALGGSGYLDGMLLEVVGQTGEGSGDVKCEVQVGNSIEAARSATPRAPFTLRAGKNLTHRPRLRGNASFIRLSTTGGSAWAYENMTVVRERLGKQRL